MQLDSPQAVAQAFAAAINGQDLQAALAIWSPDAVWIPVAGEPVKGQKAIRPILQTLIDNHTTIAIDMTHTYETASTALARGHITQTAGDGDASQVTGAFVAVYERADDGSWRLAIDAPFGLPAP